MPQRAGLEEGREGRGGGWLEVLEQEGAMAVSEPDQSIHPATAVRYAFYNTVSPVDVEGQALKRMCQTRPREGLVAVDSLCAVGIFKIHRLPR